MAGHTHGTGSVTTMRAVLTSQVDEGYTGIELGHPLDYE